MAGGCEKVAAAGSWIVDFRKNFDCGIVELRLQSNISLKCCGIAIVEVKPQVAELRLWTKKKLCMPTSD
jgi:hypothetical protein